MNIFGEEVKQFNEYFISKDGYIFEKDEKTLVPYFLRKNAKTNEKKFFVTLRVKNHEKKQIEEQTLAVDELIAKVWITNPQNLPLLNHRNGNLLDNRVVNLEWTTKEALKRFEELKSGENNFDIAFISSPKWINRKNHYISLLDGPLVYALKVEQEKHRINIDDPMKEEPHADYEFINKSEFAYGIISRDIKEQYQNVDIDKSPFVSEKAYKSILSLKATEGFAVLDTEIKKLSIAFCIWFEKKDQQDNRISENEVNNFLPEWEGQA
jgi:hypothetical protein